MGIAPSQTAATTEHHTAGRPKILFNITHGFQARMLLRSAISETLLERGATLVIVSGAAREEYFRREFSHPQIILEDMPHRLSRVESHLINLRQYLLMNPSLGTTLNFKNEAMRRQWPKRYWITRIANSVLGRIPPLREAYRAGEAALYRGTEFDDLLARHRPDLIVTGTPGVNPHDMHLLRAARRAKIETATVMLSWDNLTSKGYMGATPDHLLVWSDLMAGEAMEHHNFPKKRIHWCGAAQFDIYQGVRERFDRMAWRREHGVPEGRPLVVYGTINPALLPHELNILRQIVAGAGSSKYSVRPYFWIRLHPQVVRGYYSMSLAPFRELAGPDVFIEEPPVQSDKLPWDLPKAETEHLARLMAAADVVATPGSTLMIDAACAGTPVVNVLFDGDEPIHPAMSSRRFEKYGHQAKILETGGIAPARDIDEFVAIVEAYIRNPALDAEKRDALIRQQMNCLDGQAGVRTAMELLQLADHQN